MMMAFTDEEYGYVDLRTFTCVKANTPPKILVSLQKKDAAYFEAMGEHYLRFI